MRRETWWQGKGRITSRITEFSIKSKLCISAAASMGRLTLGELNNSKEGKAPTFFTKGVIWFFLMKKFCQLTIGVFDVPDGAPNNDLAIQGGKLLNCEQQDTNFNENQKRTLLKKRDCAADANLSNSHA